MLVLDPSEITSQSRLAPDVLAYAKVCENLETHTGADMLISPLSAPVITNLDQKLSLLALQKHLAAGAILIQRKTSDILNFISDHKEIIAKMQTWTQQPWLLTVGQYGCDGDGKITMDGKRLGGKDGWHYWSLVGALTSWQKQGGYIVTIARDNLLLEWIKRLESTLGKDEKGVMAAPRKASQQVMVAGEDGTARTWAITALMTIPGISTKKAIALVDYCGNLKHCLQFLSDPDNLKLKRTDETWPDGIGMGLFKNAADWLDLKVGGAEENQWREVLEVVTKYPFRKEAELETPF